MGIVLNHPSEDVSFSDLLVQLDIVPEGEPIRLSVPEVAVTVHRGGPVATGRGVVRPPGDSLIRRSPPPPADQGQTKVMGRAGHCWS